MTKYFLFIKIFIIISFLSFAQTDILTKSELYPFRVDSIVINGNDITKEFIILRELTFQKGDVIDYKTALYNRERIYSLGIFNQVTLEPQKTGDKNILDIIVEESWYIYPIPFVNIKERDWKKLSFGMFLILQNFRGRNETLSVTVAFGYDPTYILSYYNPNTIGNENIFFQTKIGYSNVSNKSIVAESLAGDNFEQKVIFGDLEIGRRFFLFHKLALNFSYTYRETPFYLEGVNASNERIDRLFSLGIGYNYDTRDLAQFPKSGIYANTSYIFKGLGINDINYNVARLDFRNYTTLIDKLLSKWRFTSRFVLGDRVPYYDNSIIGLEDRIRGYFYENFEGNHSYLASMELYYPIIEELHINLDFIPIIPKQLLSYRFALYTQLFADAGAVQMRNSPLGIKDFKKGYGAGLTVLILPYYSARIEYAINDLKQSEIILDLGISF